MNRMMLGLAAVIAGLSGCASPARYVEKNGEMGVVAIPSNTDAWPSYNRTEAVALIQKHVGGSYEIVEEREVATGKTTLNNQQVNNEETWNTSNPFLPANKQTVQNTTTTQDVTEWRIAYRKKASPYGPTSGFTPASAKLPAGGAAPVSAVQPAGGVIPSVAPGGGVVPVVGTGGPLAPPMPIGSIR